MRALVLSLLGLCLLVVLPGCFSVDEPICSYSCGPSGECPNDYTCEADNYCHRNGSEGACTYSDAATVDEAVPFDLESSPDAGPVPIDAGPMSLDASSDL